MPQVHGRPEEQCPHHKGQDRWSEAKVAFQLWFFNSRGLSPWSPQTLTRSLAQCPKCFNSNHHSLGVKACFCLTHRLREWESQKEQQKKKKIKKRKKKETWKRKRKCITKGWAVSSLTPSKGHQEADLYLLSINTLSWERPDPGLLASFMVPLISPCSSH